MPAKVKFNISGIHCQSCKFLIETEISALAGVNKIIVDHQSGMAEVEFDEAKMSKEKIFEEVEKLNYTVALCEENVGGISREADDKKNKKYFLPVFLSLSALIILIGGYFLIEVAGGFELLEALNEGSVSYGLIFIIGLLCGFHCVGMCGGLVVSYTAKRLADGDENKNFLTPHFQYNAGRLISYAVIGAILGGVGSFFGVNPVFTGIVMLAAGALMVLMGLSFIKNWPVLEKLKVKMPQFIARFLFSQKYDVKPKDPFIIGLLNGFMPCGPLQAMQLYALTSGDALKGALSMGIFASGTIPLMFGFGAFISKIGQGQIKKIMRFSGILVMILGLVMFNRGLVNFGYGYGGGGAKDKATDEESGGTEIDNQKDFQVAKMDLTYYGYQPNVLYIKAGKPVRWVINVKQMSGCTNAIMIESLGIKKDLRPGENIIEFTPPDNVREIKFSCGMRMVWGKFIVNK
ncbi:sulfite exporter TauE/SafE family protein [Candidatus Falkowbacteria bacterium]|nr:sulfite exporter TauE/SafE family protein [Candidatus Falkowbacteria bacterium]